VRRPSPGTERLISARLRFLLRMTTDLRFLDPRGCEHAARARRGRLIGGWSKARDAATAIRTIRPDRELPGFACRCPPDGQRKAQEGSRARQVSASTTR